MVAYMYGPKRYLGQRRGLKGHEDLIDALEICRREQGDIVGVFVGGAWQGAQRYEQRVISYGTRADGLNMFLGTRRDVGALYRCFDIAVCPSHSENVGGAVESLLAKTPTIATRVGGLPDLVRHGETGWLVPPHTPRALANAILYALSNPSDAAELADNGQRLTRQLFDVRATAAQVRSIYETILSRRLSTS
jgi:glycosyltransferase involved in cell wall biosynthesis